MEIVWMYLQGSGGVCFLSLGSNVDKPCSSDTGFLWKVTEPSASRVEMHTLVSRFILRFSIHNYYLKGSHKNTSVAFLHLEMNCKGALAAIPNAPSISAFEIRMRFLLSTGKEPLSTCASFTGEQEQAGKSTEEK